LSPDILQQANDRSPRHRDFSDAVLVERAGEALRDGRAIAEWTRQAPLDSGRSIRLPGRYNMPSRTLVYLGELELHGRPSSVMVCRQYVDLGIFDCSDPQWLPEFVLGSWLRRAQWRYPDGAWGGYTTRVNLARLCDGGLDRWTGDTQDRAKAEESRWYDWRELGAKYEWVVTSIDLNDFAFFIGALRKRWTMAVCVVSDRSFWGVQDKRESGGRLTVSVGFSFLQLAPVQNHFGSGPGKLGSAIKLFDFALTTEGRLVVRMDFVVAPRPQRVLELPPRGWDPIYGATSLVRTCTRERWQMRRVHDGVDSHMLRIHARVHQHLMDGTVLALRAWIRDRDLASTGQDSDSSVSGESGLRAT
jgi:hypothetical protein